VRQRAGADGPFGLYLAFLPPTIRYQPPTESCPEKGTFDPEAIELIAYDDQGAEIARENLPNLISTDDCLARERFDNRPSRHCDRRGGAPPTCAPFVDQRKASVEMRRLYLLPRAMWSVQTCSAWHRGSRVAEMRRRTVAGACVGGRSRLTYGLAWRGRVGEPGHRHRLGG
jgi:hypothetical protein